jgi:hypothetical protein
VKSLKLTSRFFSLSPRLLFALPVVAALAAPGNAGAQETCTVPVNPEPLASTLTETALTPVAGTATGAQQLLAGDATGAAASVVTGIVSPTFSLPFDLVGDAGPTLACP